MPDAAADLGTRTDLAALLARDAGELAMRYFQRPDLEILSKEDGSPVTIADRRAEEFLREKISAAYPADAIVGEEHPDKPGTSGFTWILDPIDGTRAFARGIPSWATLVGLQRDGRSVAGAACAAAMGETVWAGAGLGAWWRTARALTVPARVSTTARLSEAMIDTLWPTTFRKYERTNLHDRLAGAVTRMRTWSDAYSFMLAATGRIDVAIDWGVKIWDIAPFPVIFQEAGGKFTDWTGKADLHADHILASNAALHAEVVEFLR